MSQRPALVVGLGNPGPEYEATRHNVGFRVVDVIAGRAGATFRAAKGIRALATDVREGERKVILAKPTTYMNLSGEAVRELAHYFDVALEDIVVVHDELDLPFAELRIKRGGGDAGHNGLKHVTRALGSPEYARVRIGIGRPSGPKRPVDWVLEPFSKREREEIDVVIERAADVALEIVRDGLERAQNALHGPPSAKKERKLRKQVVVGAPISAVWEAWTTEQGLTSFFGRGARVDPREGGAFEIYFKPDAPRGERGAEGCEIVTFKPPTLLVFTWNNPPSIPAIRWEYTRVHLSLRAAGRERTRVWLTHSGFGDGPDWDASYAYFDEAWDSVLGSLQRRFAAEPNDDGARDG